MSTSVRVDRALRAASIAFLVVAAATCSGSPTAPTSSTGALKATVQTTGADPDPNGYVVTVDQGSAKSVSDNGTVTFAGLSTGSHSVALDSVASNCTVSGSNPHSMSVTAGDTATVSFSVSCSAQMGTLRITSSTSGNSLDSTGYAVVVDSGSSRHLALNDTLVIDSLAAADHTVQLDSVASNCTVSGSNPRTVTVPAQDTATTAFTVSCSTLTGDLRVTTSTSGSDLDPDGYAVSVDSGPTQHIAINDSLTLSGLAVGSHSVQLDSVASNCSVSGGSTQTVTVTDGGTVTAGFSISCSALTGAIKVRTETSGTDLDPDGYAISLDGGSTTHIAINDSISFDSLTAGVHAIQLDSVAANCSVGGSNPMTVTAPGGGVVDTAFVVDCVSNVGDLTVSNSTTGSNLDGSFLVSIDGGTGQSVNANDSITVTGLSAGTHSVDLSGVASNCAVQATNPRDVSITFSDTTHTHFYVHCVAPLSNTVVFESNRTGTFDVFAMNQDGTSQTDLTRDASGDDRTPAVSPDGYHIAFVSTRSGPTNIWTMLGDGSVPTDLSKSSYADRNPQWLPDGSGIVFDRTTSSGQHIWIMNADGTGQRQITSGSSNKDLNPDVSPDGTKIAFVRSVNGGKSEVYVYDRNTGALTDVSQDSAGNDFDPAWSPDGTKIVFAADRNAAKGDIYVMNADGTNQVQLTTNPASDFRPAWSADGTKIVFTSLRDGDAEIYIMIADGTGQANISNDPSARDDNADMSP